MKFETRHRSPPDKLADKISGCAWRQIHLGLSPSDVYRLEAKNEPSLYLEIAARIAGFSLKLYNAVKILFSRTLSSANLIDSE